MAGNSRISNLDLAVTLTGTEELPVVQVGETVKTTAQAIADLVISENISTHNLTSTVNDRFLTVNGSLSTNKFSFKNLSSSSIASFNGDGTSKFFGNIAINSNPSTIIQSYLTGSGVNYGYFATGSNSTASYTAQNTGSTPIMFLASKVSKTGFKADGNITGSGDRFGFDSSIINDNTGDNVAFRADCVNSGGGEAVAFHILSGEFKTPTGTGQTETVTFGGGSSGDIASMTFEKGIYISKTLVP